MKYQRMPHTDYHNCTFKGNYMDKTRVMLKRVGDGYINEKNVQMNKLMLYILGI